MNNFFCNDIINIIYRNIHELNMLDIKRELSLIELMKEYHQPKLGYTMDYFVWDTMEPIISFTYNNKYYKTNGIYCILRDMIHDGLNIKHIYTKQLIIVNLERCNRNDKYTIEDKQHINQLLMD
jgi:hypothetical protein